MNAPVFQLRPRQCRLLQLLWPGQALSRRELHRRLDVHPNLIGEDVADLMQRGILAEGEVSGDGVGPIGRGRPGVPVHIDGKRKHILGLAIAPGGLELGRINLLGQPIESSRHVTVSRPERLTRQAGRLLGESVDGGTLLVGISITGLVDEESRTLLLSSAVPRARSASLEPLYDAARGKAIVLSNDMQALATQWLLSAGQPANEDVLLLKLEDGQIGAAMLIGGRPNRGCATAANEMGHMRFPLRTPRCYCGQEGCLERLFSTEYVAMRGGSGNRRHRTLADLLLQSPNDSLARQISGRMAQAIANIVNFIRPHRVILTGSFAADDGFFGSQTEQIRQLLLSGLSDRVRVARWSPIPAQSGQIAAWGALAHVLHANFLLSRERDQHITKSPMETKE